MPSEQRADPTELLAEAEKAARRFALERRYAEALAFSERALQLRSVHYPPGSPELERGVLSNMELEAAVAAELVRAGQLAEAEVRIGALRASAQRPMRGPALCRRRAAIRAQINALLSILRRAQGDVHAAIRAAEQAAALHLQLQDTSPALLHNLLNLSALHSAKGSHRDALQYAELAERTVVHQQELGARSASSQAPRIANQSYAEQASTICGVDGSPSALSGIAALRNSYSDIGHATGLSLLMPPTPAPDADPQRVVQKMVRRREYAESLALARGDYNATAQCAAITIQCASRQKAARRRIEDQRRRGHPALSGAHGAAEPICPPPQLGGDLPQGALLSLCQLAVATELEHLRIDSPRMMATYRSACASAASSLGRAHPLAQRIRQSAAAAATARRRRTGQHRRCARGAAAAAARAKACAAAPSPVGSMSETIGSLLPGLDTSDPQLHASLKMITGTDTRELYSDSDLTALLSPKRGSRRSRRPRRGRLRPSPSKSRERPRPQTTDPAMFGGAAESFRKALNDGRLTSAGAAAVHRRLRVTRPWDSRPEWDAGNARSRAHAFATVLPPAIRHDHQEGVESRLQQRRPRTQGSLMLASGLEVRDPTGAASLRQLRDSKQKMAASRAASSVVLPTLGSSGGSLAKSSASQLLAKQVGTVPVANSVEKAHRREKLRRLAAPQGVRGAPPVRAVVDFRQGGVARAHDVWIREVLSEDFEDAAPADFDDADVAFLSSTFGLSLTKPLGQKTWVRPQRAPLPTEAVA